LKLEVARAADRELQAAFEYLRERNPRAARAVRSAIRRTILGLRRFPERGRPGSLDGTRELVVRGAPYAIVYSVSGDTIFVARIRHTSQDPQP
jgi:addiction module RelE/StbE family toxin